MPAASARAPHINASSFVPRAPPIMATDPELARRIVRATVSRASDQVIPLKESPDFTCGVTRRSSELVDWKLKRPRSHNQPQFTGSLSTPWKRRSSSRLDCTTVRQPTEHVVHVLSRCSRSHGRALNRYGCAVSAPTGQI